MKSVVHTRSVFNTTNAAIGVISLLTFTMSACIFAARLAEYTERPSMDWIVVCTIVSVVVGPILGFTYLRPAAQKMYLGLSMVLCLLSLTKIFYIL